MGLVSLAKSKIQIKFNIIYYFSYSGFFLAYWVIAVSAALRSASHAPSSKNQAGKGSKSALKLQDLISVVRFRFLPTLSSFPGIDDSGEPQTACNWNVQKLAMN